ncbi:hypothetical protein K474DRAFT_1139518 [Panus rudis PR-1116 ss-1]|nr:hypothetical protein K474DRAFT_1139518 [Panus rudis PR-1116 ss-1]
MHSPWSIVPREDDSDHQNNVDRYNYRMVAAFFLGGVFVLALQQILCSRSLADSWTKLRRSLGLTRRPPAPNARHDRTSLIFILNLCFVFAAITQFLSLLVFRNNVGWQTGCTFVVAWGGMAARCARLVGLLVLYLELRPKSKWQRESWAVFPMFLVALGLIVATNATSIGQTNPAGGGLFMCDKKHWLPIVLTSSLVQLLLEMYVATRLVLVTLANVPRGEKLPAVCNRTLCRSLSLILLELLTIVPDATRTNVLGDFLPFSIGAVIVIVAFNHRSRRLQPTPVAVADAEKSPSAILVDSPRSSTLSFIHINSPLPGNREGSSDDRGRVVERSRFSGITVDTTSSTGNAVVYTASRRHFESAQTSPSLIRNEAAGYPSPSARYGGRIVSSQSRVAEDLERFAAEQRRKEYNGPLVPPRRRPNMTIVVQDHQDAEHTPITPAPKSDDSAVYGSDILQTGHSRLNIGPRSSSPTASSRSYGTSTRESMTTTHRRYSDASTFGTATHSEAYYDDPRYSRQTGRSGSYSAAPARHSFLRFPIPSLNRSSFVSTRTKDSLQTVSEGMEGSNVPPSAFPSRRSTKSSTKSRKSSIRQPSRNPSTSTSPGSYGVPPLPTIATLHAMRQGPPAQPEHLDVSVNASPLDITFSASPHSAPASQSQADASPSSSPAPSPRLMQIVRGPRPPPPAILSHFNP